MDEIDRQDTSNNVQYSSSHASRADKDTKSVHGTIHSVEQLQAVDTSQGQPNAHISHDCS